MLAYMGPVTTSELVYYILNEQRLTWTSIKRELALAWNNLTKNFVVCLKTIYYQRDLITKYLLMCKKYKYILDKFVVV